MTGNWGGTDVFDRDARWKEQYLHWTAAVSEGLCPVHHMPLEAVAMPRGRIAGHCASCRRFWGVNLDTEHVGWWLDRDPGRFSVRVPGWIAS